MQTINNNQQEHKLHRVLNATDLILLGVGAIIGAGIFVLTGIAAATKAGPAINISYILAGLACALTAFAYAELASSIGGCGGAYGYSRVGFGPTVGWIIGWALLLEYGIVCSAVAIGWSSYIYTFIQSLGLHFSKDFFTAPAHGGILNLPALIIVSLVAAILCIGVKTSARFNAIVVSIKLAVIAIFIFIASSHVNFSYWHPFAPFGWSGISSGAAFIFFAYIGFDAVSTAAEETINPQRNLPVGILGSLAICTVIYIVVSSLLTLIVPYTELNVASPIAQSLLSLGYRLGSAIVAVGAIAGLTTVILVMYYGLTRIMLALSRDKLLPTVISVVHPKTKTPIRVIILAWVIIAICSAVVPINDLVSLVNIGTLSAFLIVCVGVIVLRYTKPDMPRSFKMPYSPVLPSIGALIILYLMFNLSKLTWLYFIIWMLLGLIIYYSYGRRRDSQKIHMGHD